MWWNNTPTTMSDWRLKLKLKLKIHLVIVVRRQQRDIAVGDDDQGSMEGVSVETNHFPRVETRHRVRAGGVFAALSEGSTAVL